MRLIVQHRSQYHYADAALLGPHVVRLRPTNHAKARIEAYSLTVSPSCELRWHQDPAGNHLARATWKAGQKVSSLELLVEIAVDIRPVNPFDFFIDDACKTSPFEYSTALRHELLPYLAEPTARATPLLDQFLATLPREGPTVPLVVELNSLVAARVRYVIREETGVWTPEETLQNERGSCRDSATLLVAVLRSRGFAARFVSGYLIQLTDEGMIPDAPRGVGRDVVDLHAWAEVYLPGGGWIGLDATSGLLTGEGHIPLACAADAPLAAPLEGSSSTAPSSVNFTMTVGRLGHEARPTRPYTDEVWEELLIAGDHADAVIKDTGLTLTAGGEPTFNARDGVDAPEWQGDALGPAKWTLGVKLANELRARLVPGGVTLERMGKHYPGEPLPRWALDIIGRSDGAPVWTRLEKPENGPYDETHARRFAESLATRLELREALMPAFEDPWRFLQDEASLPIDEDPLRANLRDPLERRRLARVLDRGLQREAGFVLPIAREGARWIGAPWRFRRGHVFLLQGDSPMGLRLPLASLAKGDPAPQPTEPAIDPPDPRRAPDSTKQTRLDGDLAMTSALRVRTALCIEPRDGRVFVFLPPLASTADFLALVAEIDATRRATGLDVALEGYPPPNSQGLSRIAVTPDPGVLEVNLPPTSSTREHATMMDTVFDAALHAGLHSEKYLLDGRLAGSGGGHHLTYGGPTSLASPFIVRPDLLASLITFTQHHPSLSFMFTGLFVGPTSQAPRIDEARHDALYEIEIAMRRAFDRGEIPAPWLSDSLFRHLLVDVSGNTHRAEICIDKLFDPVTPHGRQGLVELRAFEMPPHPRMATAQSILMRALLAAFAVEPYDRPLVRWGASLHDRFLLPYWMWQDFEDVLGFLARHGITLPADAYRPFVELRCPRVGTLQADDVTLEVYNAIEPWHVLGEEMTGAGTSRFVDSSMERVEVRVENFLPERHAVLVNGHALPMRPTRASGRYVGGVRFRAWAPPHSLHPHLGIHHPLRFDVVDTWARRSLGGCAYHVWHPEGRGYEAAPLTRFEAEARRSARFTHEGPSPFPLRGVPTSLEPEASFTLDLRRFRADHPVPEPDGDAATRS